MAHQAGLEPATYWLEVFQIG